VEKIESRIGISANSGEEWNIVGRVGKTKPVPDFTKPGSKVRQSNRGILCHIGPGKNFESLCLD
jgi:hypothetical protein